MGVNLFRFIRMYSPLRLFLLFTLLALSLSPAFGQTFSSTDTPKSLPDQATVTSTITVPGGLGTITDLNVELDITHSFDGDLDIFLTHDDTGTTILLSDQNGDDGVNYTDTVFDDEAGTAISAGAPPFTGSFVPDELLSAFDGEALAGDWTLTIVDRQLHDFGTLNSWALVFVPPGTTPGLSQARPDLLIGKSPRKLRGNNVYNARKASKKQTLKHRSRIFTTNKVKAHLLLQNDGGNAATMKLSSSGDRYPRMKVRAKVAGRFGNVTGAVKTGRFERTIPGGGSIRVIYELKTNRFYAGALRGGNRDDTVRFRLKGAGNEDNAAMVNTYR